MFLNKLTLGKASFCENIIEAASGDEAISYFEKIAKGDIEMDNLPEVILLDLNMPIMDGWEFYEAFSQHFPEFVKKTKIFILSSSINPEDQKRALNDPNIAAFLPKPLNAEEHLSIINTFFDKNKKSFAFAKLFLFLSKKLSLPPIIKKLWHNQLNRI